MHWVHVTNNGASNSTVSLLNSALFTKTVIIETNLFEQNYQLLIIQFIELVMDTDQYAATTPMIFMYFVNKVSDASSFAIMLWNFWASLQNIRIIIAIRTKLNVNCDGKFASMNLSEFNHLSIVFMSSSMHFVLSTNCQMFWIFDVYSQLYLKYNWNRALERRDSKQTNFITWRRHK